MRHDVLRAQRRAKSDHGSPFRGSTKWTNLRPTPLLLWDLIIRIVTLMALAPLGGTLDLRLLRLTRSFGFGLTV